MKAGGRDGVPPALQTEKKEVKKQSSVTAEKEKRFSEGCQELILLNLPHLLLRETNCLKGLESKETVCGGKWKQLRPHIKEEAERCRLRGIERREMETERAGRQMEVRRGDTGRMRRDREVWL